MPLPGAPIMACIDRKRDRILVGEQGKGRVCSIFDIKNGERLWDGASEGFALADYSAGAFSPNDHRISWPRKEPIGQEETSLWVTDVDRTAAGNSLRLTPSDGRVMSSSWSPKGAHVAFMWSRWPSDMIRLWVADLKSGELEPLVEGPFEEDLRALGCHSWAPAG